ncbi:MAG: hypothetical protein RJB11_1807 [Planctomycetota bacterium]|jgi:hypothetical protein
MHIPHRISLARAWTQIHQDTSLLRVQRFFQKPTNICWQTKVRLRLESSHAVESVILNGQELPLEAEKTLNFGYDWDITVALLTRNQLVVSWLLSDPVPPETPPKFDACLEIFAP